MLSSPPDMETAEPDVGMSASAEPAVAAVVAVREGKNDLTSFWTAGLEVAAAAAEEAA